MGDGVTIGQDKLHIATSTKDAVVNKKQSIAGIIE